MEPPWFILNSGPGEPVHNMAVDKSLLEAMPKLQAPALRFYSWTRPAASYGYFQKLEVVETLTRLRPLVRRPTGGGIVPHDADWTYSLVFPAGHEWYKTKATESYWRVHAWLLSAFAAIGVETELAPGSMKTGPGQCFAGYEKSDLLWRGRKIAGAAQRRTREGLLIQGSVQPPPLGLSRAAWEKAMCDTRSRENGVQWTSLDPSFKP